MLYAVIDRAARGWWYYRKLRDEGKAAQARVLERMTIRSITEVVRSTLARRGHILLTENWFAVCVSPGHVVTGSTPDVWLAIGRAAGIPVVDMRAKQGALPARVAIRPLSYFEETGASILR